MERPTRRRLLGAVGAAGGLALAGCLAGAGGAGEPRYRLSARTVPDSLADHLRWEPAGPFADDQRALMDRLLADGTLTTVGVALYPPGPDAARHVERDGTYYRFSIERLGRVERERWIFWLDLLEGEPPDDAEVVTSGLGVGAGTDLRAEYDLSALDVRVVEDAAGEVVREGGVHELEDAPPGRRGHVFRWRAPDETALLPEPPFTHVAFETGDGRRYARAVAERETVELRRYRHTASPVATSESAYVDYVRDRYLAATFERGQLPDDRRAILDAVAAGGGRHEERRPLSDPFRTVLDRLGLAGVETPEPGYTAFSGDAYFQYQGGYYVAQLEIFR